MSGYDSVNRNVSSRVRKAAIDGADVTSSNRQFQFWRPATENARLPTVHGTVNRRLGEAFAAGRLATWKVGNVSERAKVRQFTAVVTLYTTTATSDPMRSETRSQWRQYRESVQHSVRCCNQLPESQVTPQLRAWYWRSASRLEIARTLPRCLFLGKKRRGQPNWD